MPSESTRNDFSEAGTKIGGEKQDYSKPVKEDDKGNRKMKKDLTLVKKEVSEDMDDRDRSYKNNNHAKSVKKEDMEETIGSLVVRNNVVPKQRGKETRAKKEEIEEEDAKPLIENNLLKNVKSQQHQIRKLKKEVKNVEPQQQNNKKERKVYDLPGQKRDPPEERDPLRIFYGTLHKQIPSSEMAQFWMMESGLLPKEEAQKVHEKKLKKNTQNKGNSPLKMVNKSISRTTKKSTVTTTTTVKKRTTISSRKKMEVSEMDSSEQSKKKNMKKNPDQDDESGDGSDDDFVLSSCKSKKKQRMI